MGGISFFKYYSFFHSSSLVFVLSQSITPFFYLRPSLPFVPSFSSVVFVLARLPSLLFLFQYHRSSCILFTSLFFFGGGRSFSFYNLLTLFHFPFFWMASLLFSFLPSFSTFFRCRLFSLYVPPRFFFLFHLDYFHRCLILSSHFIFLLILPYIFSVLFFFIFINW